MKRNLEPDLVQYWTLVGMQSMHRAIVRSALEQLAAQRRLKFQLEWCVINEAPTVAAIFQRPGVLLIDREFLRKRLEKEPCSAWSSLNEIEVGEKRIHLLWSWSLRGARDLLWCTELGLTGVISNIESLQLWAHASLKHAAKNEIVINSLLANVTSPSLPRAS
ncbi:MAG: hypothetical protein ABL921_33705 [Pirellula sp.]